jgi:hypothetical protein
MDYKSLASNFAIAQTFLAGAGFLAPREQHGFLDKMGYYMIAIIVISTIGIGFLLAGLYMYLITIMLPYQVCMIMGAVLLGLGLAILASRIFVVYMIQRRLKKSVKNIYEDVKDILCDISEQIEKPIAENPKLGLIIALLAGFILSKKLLKD